MGFVEALLVPGYFHSLGILIGIPARCVMSHFWIFTRPNDYL